jgi:hypothetical protein
VVLSSSRSDDLSDIELSGSEVKPGKTELFAGPGHSFFFSLGKAMILNWGEIRAATGISGQLYSGLCNG